jgi:hypothetical protein
MNSRDIRIQALRAAAKVTFAGAAGAVAGCADGSTLDAESYDDALPSASQASTNAERIDEGVSFKRPAPKSHCGKPDASGPFCGITATSPFDGNAFACCKDSFATKRDETTFDYETPISKASANERLCCDAFLDATNGNWNLGQGEPLFSREGAEDLAKLEIDWEITMRCCELEGRMGTACTPWGPPVPPAMPEALEVA